MQDTTTSLLPTLLDESAIDGQLGCDSSPVVDTLPYEEFWAARTHQSSDDGTLSDIVAIIERLTPGGPPVELERGQQNTDVLISVRPPLDRCRFVL